MRRAVNYAIDRRALGAACSAADRPTSTCRPAGRASATRRSTRSAGPTSTPPGAWRAAATGAASCTRATSRTALERAEIVRQNLAAIGIELEIRRFSSGEMFARVRTPGEPFDLSLFAWFGELPDPSEFIDAMLAYYTPTGFLERTRLGRRIRAASRLAGAARIAAYAALDRDIAAQAAPFTPRSAVRPRTSSPRASGARQSIRSTASTSRRSACGTSHTRIIGGPTLQRRRRARLPGSGTMRHATRSSRRLRVLR